MGYLAEMASVRRPEVTAVHAPGGDTYVIEWQPKFARDASTLAASLPDDGLDLTGLVGALERQPTGGIPRSYRVAEFTQAADPGQTAVADHLRRAPDGGRAELWVLGASAGQTRRLAEAFGQAGAATRFATADLSVPAAIDLDRGLLRACAFDLVVIDARATALTAASWALLRRLLLPGGLILVRHPNPGFVHPGPGWSKVGTGPHGGVWAAPPGPFDDGAAELEGPRWVIAGDAYLGQLWAGQDARTVTPSGWLWSYEAQQEHAGAARDRLLRRPRRAFVRPIRPRSAGYAGRHAFPDPPPRPDGGPGGTGVRPMPPDDHHPPCRPRRPVAAGGAAVGSGPGAGPRARSGPADRHAAGGHRRARGPPDAALAGPARCPRTRAGHPERPAVRAAPAPPAGTSATVAAPG